MGTPLYAMQVMWNLGTNGRDSKTTFEELREYLHDRSIPKFEGMAGMRQKAWISNPETGRWGALYLFDSPEARQAARDGIRQSPVVQLSGMLPAVEEFDVEAVAEGVHAGTDLNAAGLAR